MAYTGYGLYSYDAHTVMADIVMADIVMAYIGTAYIVMAYIVLAYIVMAYIVMAQGRYYLPQRHPGACLHALACMCTRTAVAVYVWSRLCSLYVCCAVS